MERYGWSVSGRVQGVGFRYTAQRKAAALGLTGWVRNEPDGTVSLEVQGEKAAIEELRQFLLGNPGHIKVGSIEETPMNISDGENDFVIKY